MIRRTLALGGLLAIAACTSAAAAPVTVNLRIEGTTQTIFEGPVTTDIRTVDGHDGTGPHTCDTTNMGANPTPAPSFFGALADAADANGIDWLGTWGRFGDEFSLDRIAADSADGSHFWNQLIDFRSNQVGGCQQRIAQDDSLQILYTGFDPVTFATEPALRLQGAPVRAAVGETFQVTVDQHDGFSPPAPSQGASVAGATTAADGRATVSFDSQGIKRFKATKAGTIRSNAAEVCVYVPGSGGCGTQPAPGTQPDPAAPQLPAGAGTPPRDEIAPQASFSSIRDGRIYRRPPRLLSGHVDEDRGIHQIYIRLRMIDQGGCRWLSGRRETLTRPRTCDRARYIRIGDAPDWSYQLPFELPEGARYILDLKVLDRALNRDAEQVRFRVAG